MLVTILLALAAPTPLEYLQSVTIYPELVEFRNVRENEGMTCGEMNQPWEGKMSGFLPFAYLSQRNHVTVTPEGYMVRVPGTIGSTYQFKNQIRRAERRGDQLGVKAYRQRLADFEAKAEAFLSQCPSV